MKLPSGWSREALEQAMFVAPRHAYVHVPGMRVEERPGWHRIVTPSFKSGGMNEVVHSALSEDEAEGVIDATLAEYAELGLRFRWTLTPGSAPADLGARLAQRGLQPQELVATYRSTADVPADTAPEITVERVTIANVDEFTRVMAGGWSMEPGPLTDYHRRVLADPPGLHRMYLAHLRGLPVGVGYYVALPRSAHLMGAVVLPAHRGQGIYRALVWARLRDAAACGLGLATCHARAHTSAPVLARLGFDVLCRFTTYSSP